MSAVVALLLACRSGAVIPDGFDPTDTDTGALVDLEGRYVLKLVLAAEIQDPGPFTDDWAPTQTTTWSLADLAPTDAGVTWTETLCALSSTPAFGAQTSYPPAFVTATPVRTREGTLDAGGGGAAFSAGPFYDIVGAALDAPTDALPTEATDPRVTDDDDDGHPGVTVHVAQDLLGEGDVYVAQRTALTLAGTAPRAGRFEGLAAWSRDQVVLDASTWWLDTATTERVDPDSTRSYFVLQRVEPSADCALIAASGESLVEP